MFTFNRIKQPAWRPHRYGVCKKGVGYIGDVFKTGHWKGRSETQGRWYFEDTQLRQHYLGGTWRAMLKALGKLSFSA